MRIKCILLLALLIIATSAQMVSLVDFVKKGNTKLPAHCVAVNKNNKCTQCENGYDLIDGSCVSTSGSNNDGNLCEGNDNCGQAKAFKSEQ